MISYSALWKELPVTLKLTVPLVLNYLIGISMEVIDTLMAGHDNPVTLASVALATQLFNLVFLLIIGVGIAMSARIAQHDLETQTAEIKQLYQQGVWLHILLSIVMMLACVALAYLPQWFGTDPIIASSTKRYLLTIAVPAGLFVCAQSVRYFLDGIAQPFPSTVIQLCIIPVNIIGNWIFLRYTDLGAQGLAIASGIACVLYFLAMYLMLQRRKRWRHLHLVFPLSKPHRDIITELLTLGLPIGIAIMLETGLFCIIGLLVSKTTPIEAAANQIAVNYGAIMFMVPLGIASALTIRCGNAYGRNDWQAIRQRIIIGMGMCILFMLTSSIVMLTLRYKIAALYSPDAAVSTLAGKLLIVFALFQLFDGIQIGAAGILRGFTDTKITLIYAIIGYWLIGFPMALLFAYVFHWGIFGLWGGCSLGLLAYGVLGCYRVIQHLRRHPVTQGATA